MTDAMLEKPLPHSTEFEMALLGGILINPEVLSDVVEIVKPGDFYHDAHAEIYRAIVSVSDLTKNGDLVSVFEALKKSKPVLDMGGSEYLLKLARETPGPASAIHFAKQIADYARKRELFAAGSRIMFDAVNSDSTATDQVDRAEASIFAISDTTGELSQAEPLSDILDRELARIESGTGPSGLQTHFADLDSLTAGLQPGDMIVIAARPSMGKSALMLNIAEQMALGGSLYSPRNGTKRKVGLFTMEMSKASVAQRLLAARTGVACSAMRTGGMSGTALSSLSEAAVDLQAGIYADDSTALSISAIRSRARRMVAKWGVEVLFIDYMQLMTAPGSSKENRQVEVAAISRGIKALARELNIPVVVLSQLNRASESRSGNRPRLSDLRESGAIEQDADVVMLLHREDYYNIGEKGQDGQPYQPTNEAELIVAKQRNGPVDVVHLVWDATATRFKDKAKW